jgi:hypothetical protein
MDRLRSRPRVPWDPLSSAMTLACFESARGDLPGVAALRDFAEWAGGLFTESSYR